MKMIKILLLSSICILAFSSCNKDNDSTTCESGETAVFEDLTGLDGCGIVAKLNDGTMLEILDIKDFEVKANGRKKYCITYVEFGDLASICMVGRIVELTAITEQ